MYIYRWLTDKESACQYRRHKFHPWVRKIPWRRKWQPTPIFLSGKSHGQRSMADYSPWGHKKVRHDLETKQQQYTYIYVCVCVCVCVYIYRCVCVCVCNWFTSLYTWNKHIFKSTKGQSVKNLPAVQKTQVWSLCQEDPLEKELATNPSILAWKILGTEEPCRLQFMGLQKSDRT